MAARKPRLTLVLLACAIGLEAQQYSFQYYGVDQGLSDLAVRSLFQDRRGFLWLGTENGIFRYDGTRFQPWGKGEGLPASNKSVFGEAPDGRLLVGGDFGLYGLTGSRFEKVPLPRGGKLSWGAGIRSGPDGKTYIATDAGLVVMSAQGKLGLVPQPAHSGDAAARGIFAEKNVVWRGLR